MGLYSLRSKIYWSSLFDELYYQLHGKALASKHNNKPDVLIHIGTPKSGSSAIQHFCVSNRKILFDKGFYYPAHITDSNGVSSGHAVLSGVLMERQAEKGKEVFNKLLRDSRAYGKTLFLSSEGFYLLREELRPILSGLDVRIMAWFRNPVESFISNHNQGIKRNFSTARLNEECARFCNSNSKFYLDGRELTAWADEYGDDVCIYRPYTRLVSERDCVQSQLLSALEIDPMIANEFKYGNSCVNRGYSYDALELKRLLNSVLDKDVGWVNVPLDRYLQRYSDAGTAEASSGVQLTPELLGSMRERFDDSLNRLVNRFEVLKPVKHVEFSLEKPDVASTNMQVPMRGFIKENPKAGRWIYQKVLERLQQDSGDEALISLASLLGIKHRNPVWQPARGVG